MPDAPRVRLSVLGVVVVALFAALFGRLWYLQVAAAPKYEVQEVTNNLRTVQLQPLRGRILDLHGRVLVDNKRALVVTIDRDEIATKDERREMFLRLSGVLAVSADDLEARYQSGVDDRYLPFPLKDDVTEAEANYLKERREDFPGVEVSESWQRVYRYGPIGANVIGYMARINEDNKDDYLAEGYELSDKVGAAGIEKFYEKELRGTPGTITYEVDARERIVRVVDERPPVAGNDIQLNIDIRVQQLAEQVLAKALAERRTRAPSPEHDDQGRIVRSWGNYPAPSGAVVVEDPTNGGVIALASNPPFDPRWFQAGISQQKFEEIFGKDAGSPLFDRATQGQYAPASTFKPFVAYAALASGFIGSPYDTINDQGEYTLPVGCDATTAKCTFQNAGKARHGVVDLPRALTVSSDVFFYRLGDEMWRNGQGEVLQDGVKQWGFGARTGIQLADESTGLVPDPATRKKGCEDNPDAFTTCEFYLGDAVQLAIGQGDMLATPLQMANAYSAMANGGTVWRPNLVRAVLAAGTPDMPAPAEPECPPADAAADPGATGTIDTAATADTTGTDAADGSAGSAPATADPPPGAATDSPATATDSPATATTTAAADAASDTTTPADAAGAGTDPACPPDTTAPTTTTTAPVDVNALPEILAPGVTAPPTSAAPGDTTTTTTAPPAPPVSTRIRQVNLDQATVVRATEPTAQTTVAIPPEWRTPILDGLRDVLVGSGTASRAFAGFPLDQYPLAGKTGTAQDVSKLTNKDSSLFTAFGPLYADQQFTVTAVLEEAGFGADAAAPVVRYMFEALLGDTLPEPQDAEPLDPDQPVAGVLPPLADVAITTDGGRD